MRPERWLRRGDRVGGPRFGAIDAEIADDSVDATRSLAGLPMRRNLRLMGNLLPRQHHPLVDLTLLREASTLWLGSRNGGVTMSEKSDVKPPIETIPSVDRGISALASAHAPFLYFDRAPAFGHMNGIIRVTLEAYRDIPLLPNGVGNDRAIVAHLRMNIAAAHSLKAALERALLLAVPPPLQHHDDPSSKPN